MLLQQLCVNFCNETSLALASSVLIPPEYNVLSTMFGRARIQKPPSP